ncbi:MAG TPA: hypothetical protein VHB68_18225, partial [Steroidobacteraceae bacterium]|nr:hypothetical protein [Steroidobacteraceae bacterium]
FASRSSDLRVLETTLLDPGGIPGYCGPGRPSHVVAVAIGYGINLAAAFHVEGRLIFHNGTHRAAAAYTVWGIRKFPCVVREVSTAEDLDKVGAADVKQHLHLYLRSRRPPRLRDFFDPALHTKIRAAPGYHLQHVQINTQRLRVSAP